IKALPLTALNSVLRSLMNEGATVSSNWIPNRYSACLVSDQFCCCAEDFQMAIRESSVTRIMVAENDPQIPQMTQIHL
ncbi:MAG: hypothetical protein ACREV2_07105, partial [Burkholderiales bacterium]